MECGLLVKTPLKSRRIFPSETYLHSCLNLNLNLKATRSRIAS